MSDENVQVENSNQQEEEVLETSDEQTNDEQEEGESLEEYKTRLAKAEELANNYKIRAEKAEKMAKSARNEPQKASPKAGDLNSKDLYALMESKVPQDDVDEVVEYAKFKGISVSDALKTNFIKTTLSEKAEQRTVAEASNTGSSRRASYKVSDDTLLAKARKGEMPDNDEDLIRLIRARKGFKN